MAEFEFQCVCRLVIGGRLELITIKAWVNRKSVSLSQRLRGVKSDFCSKERESTCGLVTSLERQAHVENQVLKFSEKCGTCKK